METIKIVVAIGHFIFSAGLFLVGMSVLVWFICHGLVNLFRGKSFAE